MTEADFDAIAETSWKRVRKTKTLGTRSNTANEITTSYIDPGEGDGSRVQRAKGARDSGSVEIGYAFKADDPGQQALDAAMTTNDNYAFRVILDDAPTGGTPSKRYFVGVVGAIGEALDNPDSEVDTTATLWVNSNYVKVNAAAAA